MIADLIAWKAKRRRRVVYLDQNVWSDIAKVLLGRSTIRNRATRLHALHTDLQRAVIDADLVVAPESASHEREAGPLLAGKRKGKLLLFKAIWDLVGRFSLGVKLYPWQQIVDRQVYYLMCKHSPRANTERPVWATALSHDPDIDKSEVYLRFGAGEVYLRMEWLPNPTPQHKRWARHVQSLRQRRRQGDFDTELRKARYDLVRWMLEVRFAKYARLWLDLNPEADGVSGLEALLLGDQLQALPYVDLSAKLYAAVLSEPTRKFRNSDPVDAEVIASALPYCDLMLVDSYMAQTVSSLRLADPYGAVVLPTKQAGIEQAIEWLRNGMGRSGAGG